jgi:hypothetical protein
MSLASWLERSGRQEVAFEIASANTGSARAMETLENITSAYVLLERYKGKEAASQYLHRAISTQAQYKELVLLTLLKHGCNQALLDEVGNPDSYQYPEYAWLLTLTAWKILDESSQEWKSKIDLHYSQASGNEPYFSIGLYILERIDLDQLMERMVTPKHRVEIPYFVGLMERLKGNLEEANTWYHLVMMTKLENNLEYHAAAVELFNWAHLGTGRRNSSPGEDKEAVRMKMFARERDILVL